MGKIPAGEITDIHSFSINVGGKLYACDRRVHGRNIRRQRVFVSGVGSRDDPQTYLAGRQSVPAMEQTALRIAQEIVKSTPERM
jgi:hypothetical protein